MVSQTLLGFSLWIVTVVFLRIFFHFVNNFVSRAFLKFSFVGVVTLVSHTLSELSFIWIV